MKFIHLSDLHLVAPGTLLHGLDPMWGLERCVASIRAHHADAALCVVTGDLTHDGEPAAYDAARRCLAGLPMPVHLMIGNHDDRAAFRAVTSQAPATAEQAPHQVSIRVTGASRPGFSPSSHFHPAIRASTRSPSCDLTSRRSC